MPVDPSRRSDVRSDFLFHALLRAHFNAQQSGLSRQGLSNLGSPKILFVLMDLEEFFADCAEELEMDLEERGAPTPSQKELADILRISPATVATSLKSMERSGYVSRETDERDSRRNLISLTDRGREAMLTSRRVFQHVDEYMFHGFTEEEREQVYQLHQRMLNNLYQIGGDEDFCPPPPPPPYRKEG